MYGGASYKDCAFIAAMYICLYRMINIHFCPETSGSPMPTIDQVLDVFTVLPILVCTSGQLKCLQCSLLISREELEASPNSFVYHRRLAVRASPRVLASATLKQPELCIIAGGVVFKVAVRCEV
jgi:hypothetical protein